MLIDGDRLIRKQLSITRQTKVTFPDGRCTVLTPVFSAPRIDGEENHVSLDGEWKVTRWPFRRPEQELVSPKTVDARWETVSQPGKVFYADPEAESRPIPNWDHWDRVTLRRIHEDDGAVLRRVVRLPRAWTGKRIFLRFDSIYPAGRVYLNGELIGEHLSGLTPAEYDVTDRVRPGAQAVVAVRLIRKHRFAQLDMVRWAAEFAGLAQPACFHVSECLRVADYHMTASLDRKLAKGTLAGSVTLTNHSPRARTATLKLTLSDPSGELVASQPKRVSLGAGQTKNVAMRLTVASPRLWNDEYPNLYTVRLLLSAARQARQCISWRTGFRRLELSPRGARLNGQPVKFRGVNHLTCHYQHGMWTPREWLRENLTWMKRANVNAIRTHFLGPRYLADLCDEMGVYLLQELPIDWGTHYIHDPEWVGPALMRLEGGVRRDRHHPSVMVWTVGNENMPESRAVADDGWNHLAIYDSFVHALDPSRPTMFPPPGPLDEIVKGIFELRVGDIADTHYSFKLVKKFRRTGKVTNPRSWDGYMETTTREEALRRGWSGVWFSSEYGLMNMQPDVLNGPYLSAISDTEEDPLSGRNSLQVFADRLREEWGDMRHDPTCLGGAYFPWMCAGAGAEPYGNPWGWVRWAEDSDTGVMCGDLTPKTFFWALRVLFSPVWFPERLTWKKGQKELRFQVLNQFNQINLKDCTLRTQMGIGGASMGEMRQFRDVPMRAAPGRTANIRIPIWNPDTMAGLENGRPVVCRCALLAPDGFKILTHDIIVAPRAPGGAGVRTRGVSSWREGR